MVVKKIVSVAMGLFVAATVIPLALIQLAGSESNMTAGGVDPAVITIVVILLPILCVIAIAMYFLGD
jgi:hypothetical protein